MLTAFETVWYKDVLQQCNDAQEWQLIVWIYWLPIKKFVFNLLAAWGSMDVVWLVDELNLDVQIGMDMFLMSGDSIGVLCNI